MLVIETKKLQRQTKKEKWKRTWLTLRKLCMGDIPSQIKVATRCYWFWSSLTTESREICTFRVLVVDYLFSSFLQSTSLWCLSSPVVLPLKTILDTQRFPLRKTTIWWKTRDEINIRRYSYREAHYSHIHSPLLLFDVLVAVAVACSRLRDK